MPAAEPPSRYSLWYLLVAALFLIVPYLPTLTAPFDFVDDGCLVHRTPGTWAARVWHRTWDDFHYRGPFRPVSWAHWEGAAGLFDDEPVGHRVLHLVWAYLSALLLLWFFLELGIPFRPALLACAVAMWMPYRNEVWRALGLTEAFAMPYALLALIAALRAARSDRPWRWDLAAWTCALLAIGCKNTFAAIVPAQVYLRMTGGRLPWAEGWRCNRNRALLLSTVLVFPLWHFVAYKLDPIPKEYATQMFGRLNVLLWLCALMDAVGLECIGFGVLLLAVALWRSRRESANDSKDWRWPHKQQPAEAKADLPPVEYQHILVVACLLAICGVAIYLPVNLFAGRYTIPAAWGVDLLLALLLARVACCPASNWKRFGYGALGAGLLLGLYFNLEGQSQYAARSRLLWEALQCLETNSPVPSTVVWCGQERPGAGELTAGEGIHFRWHLQARRRKALTLAFPNELAFQRLPQVSSVLSGTARPPANGLELAHDFAVPYGFGTDALHCYLWKVRPAPTARVQRP